MRQYEAIIALYEADPQAWKTHVELGNISPSRLATAQMVADFWRTHEQTKCKAEALRVVARQYGYRNTETVRSYVRHLSMD